MHKEINESEMKFWEFFEIVRLSLGKDSRSNTTAFQEAKKLALYMDSKFPSIEELIEAVNKTDLPYSESKLIVATRMALLLSERKELWPVNLMKTHPNFYMDLHYKSKSTIIHLSGFSPISEELVIKRSELASPVFRRIANISLKPRSDHLSYFDKDKKISTSFLVDYKSIARFLSDKNVLSDDEVREIIYDPVNIPLISLISIKDQPVIYPDGDTIGEDIYTDMNKMIHANDNGQGYYWNMALIPEMIEGICKKSNSLLTSTSASSLANCLRALELSLDSGEADSNLSNAIKEVIRERFNELIAMNEDLDKFYKDTPHNDSFSSCGRLFKCLVSVATSLLDADDIIKLASNKSRDVQVLFLENGVDPKHLKNLERKDLRKNFSDELGL